AGFAQELRRQAGRRRKGQHAGRVDHAASRSLYAAGEATPDTRSCSLAVRRSAARAFANRECRRPAARHRCGSRPSLALAADRPLPPPEADAWESLCAAVGLPGPSWGWEIANSHLSVKTKRRLLAQIDGCLRP